MEDRREIAKANSDKWVLKDEFEAAGIDTSSFPLNEFEEPDYPDVMLADILKELDPETLRTFLKIPKHIPGFKDELVLGALDPDFIRILLEDWRFKELTDDDKEEVLIDFKYVAEENFNADALKVLMEYDALSLDDKNRILADASNYDDNLDFINLMLESGATDVHSAIITALKHNQFIAAEYIIRFMEETQEVDYSGDRVHMDRDDILEYRMIGGIYDFVSYYWDIVDGRRDLHGNLLPGQTPYVGEVFDLIDTREGVENLNSELIWAAQTGNIQGVKQALDAGATETYIAIFAALQNANYNIATYISMRLHQDTEIEIDRYRNPVLVRVEKNMFRGRLSPEE